MPKANKKKRVTISISPRNRKTIPKKTVKKKIEFAPRSTGKSKLKPFQERVGEWVRKSGKKADLDKIIREHRKAYHASPFVPTSMRQPKSTTVRENPTRYSKVGVDSDSAKRRQIKFIKEKIRELDRTLSRPRRTNSPIYEPRVRIGMEKEMKGLESALKTLRNRKSNVSKLTLPPDRSGKRSRKRIIEVFGGGRPVESFSDLSDRRTISLGK